jgi:NTE family protein
LRTGREVRLTSGRLDQALMATMAIPGLFTPVEWEGMTLVDGGVLNPMPVDVAREIGPRVVALDVIHDFMLTEPTQIFESRGPMGYAAEVGRRLGLTDSVEAVYQAACLLTYRLAAYKLEVSPPDLLIRPAVRRVGLFAFDRAVEAYNLGEAAARAALPQLEALARPTFVSRVGDGWRSIFHDRRR